MAKVIHEDGSVERIGQSNAPPGCHEAGGDKIIAFLEKRAAQGEAAAVRILEALAESRAAVKARAENAN